MHTAHRSTNAVFLLLLKQYIIDHDFDVRGFGDYIRETMHLKLNTYRAIAGRLCIRTKELNEKLIGKQDENLRTVAGAMIVMYSLPIILYVIPLIAVLNQKALPLVK